MRARDSVPANRPVVEKVRVRPGCSPFRRHGWGHLVRVLPKRNRAVNGIRRGLESLCVKICAPCAHVRRTDLWSVATDQRSVLRVATDQRSVLRVGCGFAALGSASQQLSHIDCGARPTVAALWGATNGRGFVRARPTVVGLCGRDRRSWVYRCIFWAFSRMAGRASSMTSRTSA